jgi:neutral ceramidase
MLLRIFLAELWMAALLFGGGFRAGVARVRITPGEPMRMAGFGPRTSLSQGVALDLWAKALAIDGDGGRAVIVTADVIGIPRGLATDAARQAESRCGIRRAQLLLNASHTHYGPVIREHGNWGLKLSSEEDRQVEAYSRKLASELASVACAAVADMAPAALAFGQGQIDFAVNRRERKSDGFRLGVNPNGPTDKEVPVLRISGSDGRLRAALFGYACHNTTLPAKFVQFTGDWAGVAQAEVERRRPGATALFLMLCGGDQNPEPRKTVEGSERHGRALAAEVVRVLASAPRSLEGPVRTAFVETELKLEPASRDELARAAAGDNALAAENARHSLLALEEGSLIRAVAYPVQALRLGGLRLLALGGEPVVDYALRAKREFGGRDLIVAGYSNDVMCYIPSLRVLREGGYEPVNSMNYYGLAGPLAPDVEERVFDAARRVLKDVAR